MHQAGWERFLELCGGVESTEELSELFDFLLTPEEKESIKTRCLIVKALLEAQQTQRQISDNLGVSIAKITRGSNELKRISPRLKQYLSTSLLAKI